jgi:hypothetical protein
MCISFARQVNRPQGRSNNGCVIGRRWLPAAGRVATNSRCGNWTSGIPRFDRLPIMMRNGSTCGRILSAPAWWLIPTNGRIKANLMNSDGSFGGHRSVDAEAEPPATEATERFPPGPRYRLPCAISRNAAKAVAGEIGWDFWASSLEGIALSMPRRSHPPRKRRSASLQAHAIAYRARSRATRQ